MSTITIKNFENIGYVFEYYKGNDKIIFCSECKDLMKKNNGKTKYCKSCADKIEKENWAERKRKQREKEKCHEIENPS